MRRARFVVFAVAMLLGALAFGGQGVVAQDATPEAGEHHPIVGLWELDTDVADPANPLSLDAFFAEGIYQELSPEGDTGFGVWEPTGANTANMTFWSLDPEGGMFVVRAELEVSDDGQLVTGSYTVELLEPDGTMSGEIGPGEVEGTKLAVEPQGEPIGTFEEVFGEQPVGTPEATPAG